MGSSTMSPVGAKLAKNTKNKRRVGAKAEFDVAMDEPAFPMDHIMLSGGLQSSEKAEPSDLCAVKDEMEYEFMAPTNSANECDPLAVEDNTNMTKKPSLTPIKTEPQSSFETRKADADPLHQPGSCPAKRPRMDEAVLTPTAEVDPLSSLEPDDKDARVIMCSSDEEETVIQSDFLGYAVNAPPCLNLPLDPHGSSEGVTSSVPVSVTLVGAVTEYQAPDTGDSTDYMWTNEEQPNRQIPFKGRPGLHLSPFDSTPYDYFRLIVDVKFYKTFITQANECALEMAKENVRFSKRKNMKNLISQWKPITAPELDIWLAILIHMSGIQCPSFSDYWSSELLHQSSFFTRAASWMSKDRWIGIMQALHFLKTPDGGSESNEPFFQINPLIQWFNNRMKQVYEPWRELCLEEPMVLWQGRLVPWRCLKDKKRGIKLHSLTEPGGLILRFSADKTDISDESASCKVAKMLLTDFKDKGHSVFMESCYNGVDLCHELLSVNTHTSGPLFALRKNIPEQIVDSKPVQGNVVYNRSNRGVVVMKWRDDYDQVLFISSEFSPSLVETCYKSERKLKPEAVAAFDSHMSGFCKPFHDLSDYGAVQKHTTNHVKISIHIIQIAVYNAFVLYNRYSSKSVDFAGFRTALVRDLCGIKKEYQKRKPSKAASSGFWHRLELTDRLDGNPKRGRELVSCKQCLKKSRKTKVTSYCVVCDDHPGLCIGECFVDWHLHLGLLSVTEQTNSEIESNCQDGKQKEETDTVDLT